MINNDLLSSRPFKEVWDKVAESYGLDISDDENSLAVEISEIFQLLKIDSKSSIIELGSGSGHLSGILRTIGYNVTMLDFSETALIKGREFFNHYFLDGKFINGNIMDLSSLEQTFDVTWNSGVMEHFDDKALYEALLSIRKITKEYFVFLVPNPNSLPYLLFRHKLMSKGRWQYGEEYIRNDYETFLKKAGFKVIKKEFVGWNYTNSQLNMLLSHNKSSEHIPFLVKNGLMSGDNAYLIAYIAAPTDNIINNEKWKEQWKGLTEFRTHAFDSTAYKINTTIGNVENNSYDIISAINEVFSTALSLRDNNQKANSDELAFKIQNFIDSINYLCELTEDLIDPELRLEYEEKFSLIDNTIGLLIDLYKKGDLCKLHKIVNKKLLLQLDDWQSLFAYIYKSDIKLEEP